MSERGIDAVRAKIAALPPQHGMSLAERRILYDKALRAFPVGADVCVEATTFGGVPGERLTPAHGAADAALLPHGAAAATLFSHGAADATLLYLHGGGYCIGSPRSHRHLAAAIARAAKVSAVVPEYRLAPEFAFPAAVDDALAAYRALLDSGVPARRIAIAGDSAGGGLTIACMLAARDAGLPLPGAAVCLSPWVDLACVGASHETLAAVDPLVNRSDLARFRADYLGDRDPRSPLCSPLYADLRGLPPLLIQVGDAEVLLDDARSLAARAQAAGVAVKLDIWPRMIHVWHWYWPMLDEGAAAIDAIGAFIGAPRAGPGPARRGGSS